ncbi:ABC transporter permease subunit [Listeria seeligeri]|uniref:ABC transporter permease subunit n=1 Tax=Listeria seeligeri TaxID=1640 RepID=UPI001629BCCB|nr:ABC transporter permease subunit [Listeria seeligeri]MBC1421318.1 ABC transporter permease subunit [Listeria seeligeri]MBC1751197.1 ABC transporter permease subunit [Listeria seeligeri]MBC1753952.1 ABC transporter permease subunit [Listeria seeligeri]MBC1787481.1 ABC transporter permease subunit [Listeria seeligeri]MBC1824354.1 ABC transporter permease subunit [Listeria seeligeri]
MKKVVKIFLHYFLGIIGIILISCVPAFFSKVTSETYLEALKSIFSAIMHPTTWEINYQGSTEIFHISLTDFITGPYFYTMKIIIASLLISLFIAYLLVILTFRGPIWLRQGLAGFSSILQAFPDFSFIFLIQMLVVYIYQQTGIFTLNFYSLNGEQIYAAPIVCLSIIPTVLFYKIMMLLMKKEWQADYIELARGKGLTNTAILFRHATPNMAHSLFYQSKTIIWFILSAYLIVEFLFGIEGVLFYLLAGFNPVNTFLILALIFTPFYFFYALVDLWISHGKTIASATITKIPLHWNSFQKTAVEKVDLKSKWRKSALTIWKCLKRPSFSIPLATLTIILVVSLIYGFMGDTIHSLKFISDSSGRVTGMAPFKPNSEVLLGTDGAGNSILDQLLVGVKYTLIIAVLIATLRVFIGYLLAVPLAFFSKPRTRSFVQSLADGMHYLPLSLLVFIVMVNEYISYSGVFETSLFTRIAFQVLIMVVIVLPITTNRINSEISQVMKKEFILNSLVFGGNARWILTKHINPQIWSKLILIWLEQLVQVLQMFVHLAIFGIFIGGAVKGVDDGMLNPVIPELSGLIANAKFVFSNHQFWIILPPLLLFMILILCFQMLASSLLKMEEERERGY